MGRKILIICASSYVGAAVYSQLKRKFDVYGTYNTNKIFPELEFLDISKKEYVEDLILKIKPDTIIHIAAKSSGGWCEKNPEAAISVNDQGTKNVVDAANIVFAKIIFISSLAIVNKDSVYSKTKIAGEDYVKNVKAGFIILRPSEIFGLSPNTTNDRPFNRILRNITEKLPAEYDDNWRFQPTWLRHITEIIEIVIKKKIINKIIPISIPSLKTRLDIANDILSDFNIKAIPSKNPMQAPPFVGDDGKLEELRLPTYSYEQMISGIKDEIKDYLKNK